MQADVHTDLHTDLARLRRRFRIIVAAQALAAGVAIAAVVIGAAAVVDRRGVQAITGESRAAHDGKSKPSAAGSSPAARGVLGSSAASAAASVAAPPARADTLAGSGIGSDGAGPGGAPPGSTQTSADGTGPAPGTTLDPQEQFQADAYQARKK